jgi:hypothetical protein
MPAQSTQSTVQFILLKRSTGWLITTPAEGILGPYFSTSLTLEVAASLVLLARHRGCDAHAFVQEEPGFLRQCILVDSPSADCDDCNSPFATRQHECSLRAGLQSLGRR